MTTRKKNINHIFEYIKATSYISVDDLLELAKMDDYEVQHKYLELKYGQNDDDYENESNKN